MKTKKQLLGIKTHFVIVNELGEVLETFRNKGTADNFLAGLKSFKGEKLIIKEVKE